MAAAGSSVFDLAAGGTATITNSYSNESVTCDPSS